MRALAALVALGCTTPPPPAPEPPPAPIVFEVPAIRVYADVSDSVRAEVLAGIDGWAQVTRSWRTWLVVSDPVGAHVRMVEQGYGCESILDAVACVDGDMVGELRKPKPSATVKLLRGKYEKVARLVIMHELGHLLGVPHMPDTIMQERYTERMARTVWVCPDPETASLAGWAVGGGEWRGCPWPL